MATPNGTRTMAVRPIVVEVASETDPDTVYTVTLPHCQCKDFRYRKGGSRWCKHLDTADAAVGGWHDPERAELARRIETVLTMTGDPALIAVLRGI